MASKLKTLPGQVFKALANPQVALSVQPTNIIPTALGYAKKVFDSTPVGQGMAAKAKANQNLQFQQDKAIQQYGYNTDPRFIQDIFKKPEPLPLLAGNSKWGNDRSLKPGDLPKDLQNRMDQINTNRNSWMMMGDVMPVAGASVGAAQVAKNSNITKLQEATQHPLLTEFDHALNAGDRVKAQASIDKMKKVPELEGYIKSNQNLLDSVIKPSAQAPVSAPDYRYHTTSPKNLFSISQKGLLPGEGQYGNGVYFAPNEELTQGYGSPTGLMLRVKKDVLSSKYGYDEFPEQGWTDNKLVNPQDIEMKSNGEWIPLVGNSQAGFSTPKAMFAGATALGGVGAAAATYLRSGNINKIAENVINQFQLNDSKNESEFIDKYINKFKQDGMSADESGQLLDEATFLWSRGRGSIKDQNFVSPISNKALVSPTPTPTPTPAPIPKLTEAHPEMAFAKPIENIANKHGVDPYQLAALLAHESMQFKPEYVSGYHTDGSGRGIAAIDKKYHPEISDKQAFDPQFAIDWAAKTLKRLLNKHGGDFRDALREYNGGPDFESKRRGWRGRTVDENTKLYSGYVLGIYDDLTGNRSETGKDTLPEY